MILQGSLGLGKAFGWSERGWVREYFVSTKSLMDAYLTIRKGDENHQPALGQ